MIGFVNFATSAVTGDGVTYPSGTIVMWHGLLANIPSGWALCDGIAASPDLRGKFLKGAAAGVGPGATGGTATHVHTDHVAQTHAGLAVTNHPALTHSGFAVATHTSINLATGAGIARNNSGTHTVSTQNSDHTARTHTVSQSAQHAAEVHAAANSEPAFYTIAYIRKT